VQFPNSVLINSKAETLLAPNHIVESRKVGLDKREEIPKDVNAKLYCAKSSVLPFSRLDSTGSACADEVVGALYSPTTMMNAYVVTFILKHPSDPTQLVNNFFVVAESDTAKERAIETLNEAVGRIKVQEGWQILDESVQPIGQEFIEEAAIKILGWSPPA
jgi:hypothetical protein